MRQNLCAPGGSMRLVRCFFWSCIVVACGAVGCAGVAEDKSPQTHSESGNPVPSANRAAASPSNSENTSQSSSISVRVCSALAAGVPCNPLASIYNDANLTSPKTSAQIDAADGSYQFYAKSDMYVVQVSGPGFLQNISAAVPPTRSGAVPRSLVTVQSNSDGSISVRLSGGIIARESIDSEMAQPPSNSTTGATAQPRPPIIIRKPPTPQPPAPAPPPPGPNPPPSDPATTASNPPALEPSPGSPVQYVDFSGNDSNDGFSWGTAKATVMAAYDALPADGGTIFIMQGPGGNAGLIPATNTAGEGIWIMGPNDPNYASPPPGWRRFKPSVDFIGVAGTARPANSHSGIQVAMATTGPGRNQPCIWLSALGGPILFQNLACPAAGRGIVIGESSDNRRDGSGQVANATFDNVAVGGSPGADITGGSFWLYFNNCVLNGFGGNPSAPANELVAMLIDGTGIAGNGLIFVTNLSANGGGNEGGIRFVTGSGANSLTVNGMTSEAVAGPAIYVTDTTNYTTFSFENITNADPGPGPGGGDAVMIGGAGPPGAVLVSGSNLGAVVGPATVLSQYPNGQINTQETPEQMGQVGFFNGYVVGETDAARRNFSPVAVQFPNIAPQIPGQWLLPSGATVTSGILAPDGTYGAGRVSAPVQSQPGIPFVRFYARQISMTVGDYFIGGVWLRSPTSGFAGSPTIPILLGGDSTFSISGRAQGAVSAAPNVWSWQWLIYKITNVTVPSPYVEFGANVAAGSYLDAYAPILIHIPSGTVSDDEAYQIATNLTSYPDGLPAGTVATLRGQQFAFGGTGNFFGIFTQSNTANRTYTFPDASGPVALTNLAQNWTAPQTLNSAVLTDPTIDGQPLDSPPLASFGAFLPGALSTAYAANSFTPDYPIVVTRLEVTLKTPSQGCASSAVVSLQQGSNNLDLPIPFGTTDSGPTDLRMAAGTPIQVLLSTPAQGCSIPPQDANVVVHYRMQ